MVLGTLLVRGLREVVRRRPERKAFPQRPGENLGVALSEPGKDSTCLHGGLDLGAREASSASYRDLDRILGRRPDSMLQLVNAMLAIHHPRCPAPRCAALVLLAHPQQQPLVPAG